MRRKYTYTNFDNYIKISINVTSTTTKTQIISSNFTDSSLIDYITFNDPHSATKYDFDTAFLFTYTGTRIGYIHFKQGVTSLENLFADITVITEVDLNKLNTSKVTSMNGMCMGCTGLIQCLLSNCRADSLTSMVNTFNSCNNLKYVDFGSYIHGSFKPTSKLTDVRNLFNHCKAITYINMSMFDLSGVTLFGYIWGNCTNLVELYLNSYLNPNATYVDKMFINSGNSTSKLYYNNNHDYQNIVNILPSTWTLTPYNY